MDRRPVITTSLLILALAALTTTGLFSSRGASAAAQAAPLPEPAPCAMLAPSPAATARDAATVASRHLAPAGMSGEFSTRMYACRDGSRAPSIHVPHDTWSPMHRGQAARTTV